MAALAFTDDWKAKILKAVFANVAFVPPEKVYLALYLSNPGPTGIGTEPAGGGYARVEIPWDAVKTDPVTHEVSIANADLLQFPKASADWGIIGWNGITDAPTGGTIIASAPLVKPREVLDQDIVQYETGDIKASAT